MRNLKYILVLPLLLALQSCKTSQPKEAMVDNWYNIAIADDVEIFVDSTSIKREDAVVYAYEKRVYTSPESRKLYVDKIRDAYAKMGKIDKVDKWSDFSYCIYYCRYECVNNRFQILSIEDFDSMGKRIAKTTPAKGKAKWLDVKPETVGDHTFFYICDYE